jgi:hypothetical protein
MFRRSLTAAIVLQFALGTGSVYAQDDPNVKRPDWTVIQSQVQRVEIIHETDVTHADPAYSREVADHWDISVTFRVPFLAPTQRIVDALATSHYRRTDRLFAGKWRISFFGADGTALAAVYLDRWGTYGILNGTNVEITDSRVLAVLKQIFSSFSD